MKNKRSKGVTFWAWLFIVSNIWKLLDLIINEHIRIQQGYGFFVSSVFLCITYLICGFFLLQLKEPARKAAIYLGLIRVIILICYFYLIPAFRVNNFDAYSTKTEVVISEQMKSGDQSAILKTLKKNVSEENKKIMPFAILGFIGLPAMILELLPICFFTRSKVKEQFAAIKSI